MQSCRDHVDAKQGKFKKQVYAQEKDKYNFGNQIYAMKISEIPKKKKMYLLIWKLSISKISLEDLWTKVLGMWTSL